MKIFWIFAFFSVLGYFYGLNYYYKLSYTPAHPGEIKIKSEMTKQELSALWIAKATPERKIK